VEQVREQVRRPYCDYIRANLSLLKGLAFSRGSEVDITALPAQDQDEFVSFLYDRFFSTRALLGTPESCRPLVDALYASGVDEIACLLDFGPPTDLVLDSLPHLARLQETVQHATAAIEVRVASEPLPAIQARCAQEMTGPAFYRRLQDRGIDFGASLQQVDRFWRRDGEALARLGNAAGIPLLDAALQAFVAALPQGAFTSNPRRAVRPGRRGTRGQSRRHRRLEPRPSGRRRRRLCRPGPPVR
jgi:hypothetical protein